MKIEWVEIEKIQVLDTNLAGKFYFFLTGLFQYEVLF